MQLEKADLTKWVKVRGRTFSRHRGSFKTLVTRQRASESTYDPKAVFGRCVETVVGGVSGNENGLVAVVVVVVLLRVCALSYAGMCTTTTSTTTVCSV